MLIRKRRITKLAPYLSSVRGEEVFVALRHIEAYVDKLVQVGFPTKLEPGNAVLPRAVGKVSAFNADGKYEIMRDQPMETAYRQTEWPWTEWHGSQRVQRIRIVDVPYQRYPRKYIEPPSIEIISTAIPTGNLIAYSGPIARTNEALLKHTINLYLEIFGECEVLDDLSARQPSSITRLNWTILPKGPMPWSKLKEHLRPLIKTIPNEPVVRYRFNTINKFEPEFHAVGNAGFAGYVIFGFPKKNLYVLESIHHGNATYVLEQDWERLSQLTKAQLLDNRLHKDRFIHLSGWRKQVTGLLEGDK